MKARMATQTAILQGITQMKQKDVYSGTETGKRENTGNKVDKGVLIRGEVKSQRTTIHSSPVIRKTGMIVVVKGLQR